MDCLKPSHPPAKPPARGGLLLSWHEQVHVRGRRSAGVLPFVQVSDLKRAPADALALQVAGLRNHRHWCVPDGSCTGWQSPCGWTAGVTEACLCSADRKLQPLCYLGLRLLSAVSSQCGATARGEPCLASSAAQPLHAAGSR